MAAPASAAAPPSDIAKAHSLGAMEVASAADDVDKLVQLLLAELALIGNNDGKR